MVDLNICVGSSCHLKGSYNVIQIFQQLIEDGRLHEKINMQATFCMKQCQEGVSVLIGGKEFSILPETSREFFRTVVLPQVDP
ncbi:MAG: (2Fe-2S) ferredoxin domain-containing protein [Bifidobacteriaceae bacterium]|jgi:NADH:ubiquinone oxidoreductase subunit E|nr:(2Fe-2S) ferredoxin domain-containing protein [Bifidobacteriaceae bacterium]